MRFCANCGNQLTDDDVFCGNCGSRAPEMPKPSPASAPGPAQAPSNGAPARPVNAAPAAPHNAAPAPSNRPAPSGKKSDPLPNIVLIATGVCFFLGILFLLIGIRV